MEWIKDTLDQDQSIYFSNEKYLEDDFLVIFDLIYDNYRNEQPFLMKSQIVCTLDTMNKFSDLKKKNNDIVFNLLKECNALRRRVSMRKTSNEDIIDSIIRGRINTKFDIALGKIDNLKNSIAENEIK